LEETIRTEREQAQDMTETVLFDQEQASALRNELTAITEERDELKQEADTLWDRVSAMELVLKQSEDATVLLAESVAEDLQGRLQREKEKDSHISKLGTEVSKLGTERARLTGVVDALGVDLEAGKVTIERLEKELLEGQEREKKGLLEGQEREKKGLLEGQERETELKNQISDLKFSFDSERESHVSMVERLREELEAVLSENDRITGLEDQLTEAEEAQMPANDLTLILTPTLTLTLTLTLIGGADVRERGSRGRAGRLVGLKYEN